MTKNTIITAVGFLALMLAAAATVWLARPFAADTQKYMPSEIVGALVSINGTRSSITVASADGREATFAVSYKTPVTGLVKPGEAARALGELAVGDMLAVTADPNTPLAAKKIMRIPPSEPAQTDKPTALLMGTLVSQTSTGITMRPSGDAAMDIINTDVTVALGEDTVVLVETPAGQTGKSLADISPGTKVKVVTAAGEPPVVLMVEVLLSSN